MRGQSVIFQNFQKEKRIRTVIHSFFELVTLDKFPPQINILFSDPLTILNIWLNLHYFCKDLIDFGFNWREMLTIIEFQFQIPDLAWKELSSLDFYSFFLSLWKLITVTLQVNRLKWHKARSFTNQYMFFFFFLEKLSIYVP